MKRLNRLWSRRRSWSSPGPSWPPETPKVETDTYVEKATVSLRSWSGTFRAELHNAWADEWEKITGATEISSVSRAVWKQGGQNWFFGTLKIFQRGSTNHLNWAVGEVNYHPKSVHLLYYCLKNKKQSGFTKLEDRMICNIKGEGEVHLIKHGNVTSQTSVFIGNRKFLHDSSQMELGHWGLQNRTQAKYGWAQLLQFFWLLFLHLAKTGSSVGYCLHF